MQQKKQKLQQPTATTTRPISLPTNQWSNQPLETNDYNFTSV